MIFMKRKWGITNSVFVLTSILFISPVANAAAYTVTTNADSGPGSLRAALLSGATLVNIPASVSDIVINSTLSYGNRAPLKIVGSGQTIDGNGGGNTLLNITDGADLTITNLNFTDGGGYDVNNQGGGEGIFIDVSDNNQIGIVNLSLSNVAVTGVGLHGIFVNDCDLLVCGAGGGGGGDGSKVSIHVALTNVTVDDAGNGGFDADGVRINDRNDGDIVFNAVDSTFTNIGADGVELDEGDDGDVVINVRNSVFDNNGGYCVGVPPQFPDDTGCVEDDDGDLVLDLDDGFDIDEAGNGSLSGQVKNVEINDNLDEGLDFDEEGEGSINIDLVSVTAIGNGDEGIKISEENDGDVTANLRTVTVVASGDDGIQIEQDNAGEINVTVNATNTMDNAKKGLKVGQDGSGGGSLKVRGSNISDGIASDVPEI